MKAAAAARLERDPSPTPVSRRNNPRSASRERDLVEVLDVPMDERLAAAHLVSPLHRVRNALDAVLPDALRAFARGAHELDLSRRCVEVLVRAMVLQDLCRVHDDAAFAEHLHYHLLYRWFLGLDRFERMYDAERYAQRRGALRGSAAGRDLLASVYGDAGLREVCTREGYDLGEPVTAAVLVATASGAEPSVSSDPAPDGSDRLRRARDCILQSIGDPGLSAETLAEALCMSRRSLFSVFSQSGLTPMAVIRDLRLSRCKDILDGAGGHHKLTSIAFDHGFRHYSTFSRLFKERYGVAPCDYQKLSSTCTPSPRVPTARPAMAGSPLAAPHLLVGGIPAATS